MVKLSILSYRGNSNSRFFPHSGYLGLTPVKVEGVVRTNLDEDRKPLLASSVYASVRCIEARLGRVGVVNTNVLVEYTQVLWSKPNGVDWADLGDGEFPFKIVVPTKTPGFTYANFQDYRVFWRIEAVIEHAPTFGVGSRKLKTYEIPLVRYDTQIPRREPLTSPARILTTRKPRAPVIQYQLLQPTSPIGPLDIVTVQLMLRPIDRSVVIRNASMVVERRIELSEAHQLANRDRQDSSSPSPSPSPRPGLHPLPTAGGGNSDGPMFTNHDRHFERRGMSEPPTSSTGRLLSPPPDAHFTSSSLTSLSSTYTSYSASTTTDERPLLNPIMTDLPAKTISLTVAHVDSTGAFTKDPSGAYTKTMTLQWPASKSNSHWAMGETMQTEMIRVRFFIHVKIIVSSPSTGTETIELEERELFLIATNESERKLAATKYADASARSKSKSPRRSKAPLSESSENQFPSPHPIPPVPQSANPVETRNNFASHHPSCSSPTAVVLTPPQTLRRPHTSAGPRDKSSNRTHHRHHEHHRERDRNREGENPGKLSSVFRSSRRPETARPTSASKDTHTTSPTSAYPYPPTHARRSSREVNGGAVPISGPDGTANDPKSVRAWEEELARIERTSRRMSTDVLGFNLKRLRMRASRPKTLSKSLTSDTP
ncbi:hypothetical protein ACEPAH_4727 [Sanghuangporus vaninii]